MTQTSLNIGSIGQKLESARHSKGVSVSEAGRATKILAKFIEAMEADDFAALSAPVYAKSFIKMYARYLGLDERPLVDEYVAQHASGNMPQLSDEVRHNIAKADVSTLDSNGATSSSGGLFNGLSDLFAGLSRKTVMIAAGVLIVLIIFLTGITQCAGDGDEAPAATGGAARAERPLLSERQPDVYLVRPGMIEVEQ